MKKTSFSFILTILCFNLYAKGDISNHRYFSLFGTRSYKVFLPSSHQTNHKTPVILALHGCTQTTQDFYQSTRLNKWAERNQYAVIYPEQKYINNPSKCWNWFLPINQWRSSGELEIIMGSLESSIQEFSLDRNKVFAMGFSAGGAMTSVVANCYSDKIKAAAIHSGVMYKASTSMFNAMNVLNNGTKKNPLMTAKSGFICSRKKLRPSPLPILIFQGEEDTLVTKSHKHSLATQFLTLNDYLDNGEFDHSLNIIKETKNLNPSNKYSYQLETWSSNKSPVVKTYMIKNLTHAWSGGDPSYEYNDKDGPDATKIIIDFFNSQK